MNNEPVIGDLRINMDLNQQTEIFDGKQWSLLKHPVKEYKEPSVKEIDDLWLDVINNIPANDHRPREWHFANAILTKKSGK